MMKILTLAIQADLTRCSLCEAIRLLKKNGDTPRLLTVSPIDQYDGYMTVTNMNEDRGFEIEFKVDKQLPDDAWILFGKTHKVFVSGA